MKQLELAAYFQQTNEIADAELKRLRELRAKAAGDRRMDEFLRLRQAGFSVDRALEEVDRRFPPRGPSGADNDNGNEQTGEPVLPGVPA